MNILVLILGILFIWTISVPSSLYVLTRPTTLISSRFVGFIGCSRIVFGNVLIVLAIVERFEWILFADAVPAVLLIFLACKLRSYPEIEDGDEN